MPTSEWRNCRSLETLRRARSGKKVRNSVPEQARTRCQSARLTDRSQRVFVVDMQNDDFQNLIKPSLLACRTPKCSSYLPEVNNIECQHLLGSARITETYVSGTQKSVSLALDIIMKQPENLNRPILHEIRTKLEQREPEELMIRMLLRENTSPGPVGDSIVKPEEVQLTVMACQPGDGRGYRLSLQTAVRDCPEVCEVMREIVEDPENGIKKDNIEEFC